jgi:hypothetical protein
MLLQVSNNQIMEEMGSNQEGHNAVMTDPPPNPTGVNETLLRVLQKCLAMGRILSTEFISAISAMAWQSVRTATEDNNSSRTKC